MHTIMVNEDFQYRFFEPYQPVEQYRCHLPHWRQEGVFYFVTFRLGDSLPLAILKSWVEERRIWLAANGITPDLCEEECAARYEKIPENVRRVFEQSQRGRFFIELDRCHGDCPLRNPHAASIVGNAMQFFHRKKTVLWRFCYYAEPCALDCHPLSRMENRRFVWFRKAIQRYTYQQTI